jgi:serine/threonine protein kinase
MVDETVSSYYVVMEFVDGGELFDEILARERFSERDAAPLICQVW